MTDIDLVVAAHCRLPAPPKVPEVVEVEAPTRWSYDTRPMARCPTNLCWGVAPSSKATE